MPDVGPSDLAIIIPTRNRWDILSRTIGALHRQSVSGFEIVVVVDGTDQRPPVLDGVRVVVKEHGGPGAARNAGVAATDRGIVLFLGDDMVPVPTFVAAHLERHRSHPRVEDAVLGYATWHPDVAGNPIHQWMDASATQFDYANITGEDAGWGRFYSSNVSLKRELFLATGGFDEGFTYYYEDLDLAWRLNEKGMRLLFAPDALTHHLHRYRWPDVVRRFQGIAQGEHLMARKHAWFEPWFKQRLVGAASRPRVSGLWRHVLHIAPERGGIKRRIDHRVDRWYHQQLAPYFLDAWAGAQDLQELQDYLGDDFDHARLIGHEHEVQAELEAVGGDEPTLYRTSQAYLYDLTAFAMSGTKIPYRRVLTRLVPRGGRLLDWGCGIGADGLRFTEDGYRVDFADFDNPSTRYLRWRLTRRGIDAHVFDIDTDDIPSDYDAVYAFDVIEHVEDPFGFLGLLEQRARIVMVNLLEEIPDDPHPHRPLPIGAILDRATERGLLWYRRYHGRSHLVAYRGTEPSTAVAARITSRIRRRLGPWAGRVVPD